MFILKQKMNINSIHSSNPVKRVSISNSQSLFFALYYLINTSGPFVVSANKCIQHSSFPFIMRLCPVNGTVWPKYQELVVSCPSEPHNLHTPLTVINNKRPCTLTVYLQK